MDTSRGGGLSAETRSGTKWTVALYIRQAYGLDYSPDIPELPVEVPQHTVRCIQQTPSPHEWESWLRKLSVPWGDLTPPDDCPALLQLYSATAEAAKSWEDTAVRPEPYAPSWSGDLIHKAKQLGRRREVFHLTEIIPVEGLWHTSLSPSYLLVSADTWKNYEEMDAILRPRYISELGLD